MRPNRHTRHLLQKLGTISWVLFSAFQRNWFLPLSRLFCYTILHNSSCKNVRTQHRRSQPAYGEKSRNLTDKHLCHAESSGRFAQLLSFPWNCKKEGSLKLDSTRPIVDEFSLWFYSFFIKGLMHFPSNFSWDLTSVRFCWSSAKERRKDCKSVETATTA